MKDKEMQQKEQITKIKQAQQKERITEIKQARKIEQAQRIEQKQQTEQEEQTKSMQQTQQTEQTGQTVQTEQAQQTRQTQQTQQTQQTGQTEQTEQTQQTQQTGQTEQTEQAQQTRQTRQPPKSSWENLRQYGFREKWEKEYNLQAMEGQQPGRILSVQRNLYQIMLEEGPSSGEVSGRMRFASQNTGTFPGAGDWVCVTKDEGNSPAIIQTVIKRVSSLSRKAAGNRTDEQVMAANFHTVFLVMSLNHDFNVKRMERYLATAWESGGVPVVVLTKKDLCPDAEAMIQEAELHAPGVSVVAVSALTGEGMSALDPWLVPGQTVAVAGSSGVGKSTLLNALAGQEVAAVSGIRAGDDRGMHTTTHRALYRLPSGALLLDMPGIRELQLWDVADGLAETFSEIESLSATCRFTDCRHQNEPGCAVRKAITDGTLTEERLISYQKLGKEQRFIEAKQDAALRLQEKNKWKTITKQSRAGKVK